MKKLEAQHAVPILKKYALAFLDSFIFAKKEELQRCAKKIRYPATLSLYVDSSLQKEEVSLPITNISEVISVFETLKGVAKKKYAQVKTPFFKIQPEVQGELLLISLQQHAVFGPVLTFTFHEKLLSTFLPLQEEFFHSFFSTFSLEKQKTQLIGFLSRVSKLSEDKHIQAYDLSCVLGQPLLVKEARFAL